ncbi:hypothetical protein EVAR_67790_1 [Eumeta japonica]|uniref:Uncharacterized protein n=1 Tax=Eumeta variegata TaxID=151549 RepID=A0A4C1ZX45_EUMVA|nr:hypothetical protein EVAR_67790_1 [Eumeta japonica]
MLRARLKSSDIVYITLREGGTSRKILISLFGRVRARRLDAHAVTTKGACSADTPRARTETSRERQVRHLRAVVRSRPTCADVTSRGAANVRPDVAVVRDSRKWPRIVPVNTPFHAPSSSGASATRAPETPPNATFTGTRTRPELPTLVRKNIFLFASIQSEYRANATWSFE